MYFFGVEIFFIPYTLSMGPYSTLLMHFVIFKHDHILSITHDLFYLLVS